MTDSFYKIYSTYPKNKLMEVLENEKDFQPEAVAAARKVAREKDWLSEMEKKISDKREEDEKEYRAEVEQKAEHYKKAVEFQRQKNSFYVRIPDVPKLEAALAEHGIDFFKEDKNVGVQLDAYPTETYYFNTEDLEIVDQITKDIGLRSAAYVDPQPFFKFELKVTLIVILGALLLALYLYLSE
jgi:hypothetical protein